MEENDLLLGRLPRYMPLDAAECLPEIWLDMDAEAGRGKANNIYIASIGRVWSEEPLIIPVAYARKRSLFLPAAVYDLTLLKLTGPTYV